MEEGGRALNCMASHFHDAFLHSIAVVFIVKIYYMK